MSQQPHNLSLGAEAVALTHYILGFRPEQSLVLIPPTAPATPAVVRVDLAHVPDARHRLVGYVRRSGGKSVIVLAFTQSTEQASAALVDIGLALAAAEIEMIPMHVTATTYTDPTNPGGGPLPLTDVQRTRIAAAATFEGMTVADNRAALIPPASNADARKVARKRAALALRVDPDTILTTWTAALRDPWAVDPQTLGDLAASLTDRPLRDAVLLSMCGATPTLVAATAHGNGNADETTDVVTRVLNPGGVRPPADLPAWKQTLTQVATHTDPDPVSAPAWALLGFVAWWEGNSAHAHLAVTRALTADPRHRFAMLVDQMVKASLPPGWVH